MEFVYVEQIQAPLYNPLNNLLLQKNKHNTPFSIVGRGIIVVRYKQIDVPDTVYLQRNAVR